MNPRTRHSQRGGFVMGLVVGLLLGLAMALGVALYVTKVPVPFVNKVHQRTAEQDAAELEKNKNWDPNGPLQGKAAARPGAAASAVAVPPPAATAAAGAKPGAVLAPAGPAASGAGAAAAAKPAADGAASAVVAKAAPPASTKPGVDPFTYLVQAGAYARTEEAEQQRAKLAMLGYEARLTEREQSGRTMYRVRIGPFDKKADAEAAREKLTGAGVDAAVVTVQK
jgi:cell division protein FtsN